KAKRNMSQNRPKESSTSLETVESLEAPSSQNQKRQGNIQQYMDQQLETQRELNAQYMEMINRRFTQLEQMNLANDENNQIQCLQSNEQRPEQQTEHAESELNSTQGNYPSTPIINNLIMRTPEAQENERGIVKEPLRYKVTTQKFPVVDYTTMEPLTAVQEMGNQKAIETE
ncbi:16836_t:CDS:2, partial [Cetraspora pellucida]